jgi:hypothetical protein
MNMSTNISDLPDALHEEEQMMFEQPEMEMPMEQEYEDSEMEFEEQPEQVEEFGNLGEYSIVKAVRAELTLNNLVVFLALVLAALPQVAGLAAQGLGVVGLAKVLPATQFNVPVVVGLVLMIVLVLARRFLL